MVRLKFFRIIPSAAGCPSSRGFAAMLALAFASDSCSRPIAIRMFLALRLPRGHEQHFPTLVRKPSKHLTHAQA